MPQFTRSVCYSKVPKVQQRVQNTLMLCVSLWAMFLNTAGIYRARHTPLFLDVSISTPAEPLVFTWLVDVQ